MFLCPNCDDEQEMIADAWYNAELEGIEILIECTECKHQYHTFIFFDHFDDIGVMEER